MRTDYLVGVLVNARVQRGFREMTRKVLVTAEGYNDASRQAMHAVMVKYPDDTIIRSILVREFGEGERISSDTIDARSK